MQSSSDLFVILWRNRSFAGHRLLPRTAGSQWSAPTNGAWITQIALRASLQPMRPIRLPRIFPHPKAICPRGPMHPRDGRPRLLTALDPCDGLALNPATAAAIIAG